MSDHYAYFNVSPKEIITCNVIRWPRRPSAKCRVIVSITINPTIRECFVQKATYVWIPIRGCSVLLKNVVARFVVHPKEMAGFRAFLNTIYRLTMLSIKHKEPCHWYDAHHIGLRRITRSCSTTTWGSFFVSRIRTLWRWNFTWHVKVASSLKTRRSKMFILRNVAKIELFQFIVGL